MEASMLFVVSAVLCGFVCVVSIVLLIQRSYRHKCMVLEAQNVSPSIKSLFMLSVRSGVPSLIPFSRVLMRNERIDNLLQKGVTLLQNKGIVTSSQSIMTLFVAALLGVFVVIGVITHSFVAAAAVSICMVVVVILGIGSTVDKMQDEFREEIPVVLELMTTCFSSGFTLLQTFQQIAHDIKGQLGKLFAQGAHILETGGSVAEALSLLKERTDIPELAFVIAALEVQHQNGGAIGTILSTAAESVKGELALKQTLRVQTAQAKLSARVVIIMPFILMALFSLISPNFLSPFFSSIAGFALFGIAILMEAAGIVLVRRSLGIGGLS